MEDDAREQLAGAIRREVVPHLIAIDRYLATNAPRPITAVEIEPLINETERALDELRAVCRGVFPALLERRGLLPALTAELESTHPLAVLDADEIVGQRVDRAAEAAGYLFCTEVAPADRRTIIGLRVRDERLIATITGGPDWTENVGGADGVTGSSTWQHARDRVAALAGTIEVRQEGAAMKVTATIPLTHQPDRELVMVPQTSSSRSGPNNDFGT